jgi:hypothetical protein
LCVKKKSSRLIFNVFAISTLNDMGVPLISCLVIKKCLRLSPGAEHSIPKGGVGDFDIERVRQGSLFQDVTGVKIGEIDWGIIVETDCDRALVSGR